VQSDQDRPRHTVELNHEPIEPSPWHFMDQ
jgi:hypothetical protein